MSTLTRVVAAVVDTTLTTFYREDGTTIVLYQGDKRLRPILETITPLLMSQGYADVDFSTENSFAAFEEKSKKGIKFFRIAKEAWNKLINGLANKEPEYGIIGEIPVSPSKEPYEKVAQATNAVAQILAHGGVPAQNTDFHQENKVAEQRPVVEANGRTPSDRRSGDVEDEHHAKATDTIVAVTSSGKMVPGVELIKSQVQAAAESGNVKGMEKFLERAGRVASKRKHTIEDLLRFMERGDMPIANDGTIIIYKRLFREKDGRYTDPHTRKVSQTIGSYVHMDESLVDTNRRNECSNGLHVGRRGYMGSFHGNAIVLAKVRPEDVIAVPDYDANKMRVCGYHILFELTAAQFRAICSNRPISDAEGGAELLGRAISGNHCGVLEHVKITGPNGSGLIITPKENAVVVEEDLPQAQTVETTLKTPRKKKLTKKKKKVVSKKTASKQKAAKKKLAKAASESKPVTALEAGVTARDTPVDVKGVLALASGQQADLSTPAKPQITQKDVIRALVQKAIEGDRAAADEALQFKKTAKKNWPAWGLPENTGTTMQKIINGESLS